MTKPRMSAWTFCKCHFQNPNLAVFFLLLTTVQSHHGMNLGIGGDLFIVPLDTDKVTVK